MNWTEFQINHKDGSSLIITRDLEGNLDQHLGHFLVPGEQVVEFVKWLNTPRPLMPGDFVSFRGTRYDKDAGQVLAVVGKRAWVRAVWDTSHEEDIFPISCLTRIPQEEAAAKGFRMDRLVSLD